MQLLVNGESYEVDVGGETTLLAVLRHDLGLTGTKYGCGEGDCGACTVDLNGMSVKSCTAPALAFAVATTSLRNCSTCSALATAETATGAGLSPGGTARKTAPVANWAPLAYCPTTR